MQYNNNDEEFLDETHILDNWIEEEFGWELCNFCVIGNEELLIWISEDNKPTFNELEKISNFLNTKNIIIYPLCCNPCGYSVLECINNDQDLKKFVNIQLIIKNWEFTKLREYYIRKKLESF